MGSSSTSTSSPSHPRKKSRLKKRTKSLKNWRSGSSPGCEVLVATHMDTEHLHSHLIVNSVHPDTGKKLHFTPNTLEQMRKVSDQLCEEHGLTTLKPYQQDRRIQGLRAGEYRAASRGESWKFQLIIAIEEVMKRAGTREEFLREMNQQGYQVRWEEGRKSITYTTPTGKKCRDDKLHELKFRKEQMEHEFRIRQRAAQQRAGRPEAEAEGVTNHANPDGPAGQHPLHHAAPDIGAVGAGPRSTLALQETIRAGMDTLATKKSLEPLATEEQLTDWLARADKIHQEICQDLRQTVSEMKEEGRQAGKRREEFMRRLSELEEQFRRNWDEASARFQGKILLTLLASGILSAAVSVLMWRLLL